MIVHNDVTRDSRVLKEAASLAQAGWSVVVVGMCLTGEKTRVIRHEAGFTIINVKPPFFGPASSNRTGLLLRLLVALPALIYHLRRINARVYHANDFTGLLQVALAGIWRRPVIYDSHELFFDRPLPDLIAPARYLLYAMRRLEKILARRTVGMITVNDSIADRLQQTLGVPRPVVVRNAVDRRDLQPCAAEFPRNGRKLVIHTGRLIHARHLPELITALTQFPEDVALVLMGEGPLEAALLAQAEQMGVRERVIMVPPVPPAAVAPTLAQADVAVVLTSTLGLNNQMALPNKFFEAVAGGVPVVTGPNEEIAARVRQYDLGTICDARDPASIAQAIRTVLEPANQARYRANARLAQAELNWEAEERKLVECYRQVFARIDG